MKITCGKCHEGEMVGEELVQIGFEIRYNGAGGFDYTGNKLYENTGYDDDVVAVCRECGYRTPLYSLRELAVIDGKVEV